MVETIKRRGTPLSVRIASDIHKRITDRADEADQSVTNAVERALLLGLEKQREWERFAPSLTSLFDGMTDVARDNPTWLIDPAVFERVRDQWVEMINVFHPNNAVLGEKE
jgi:hypothetical protein